MNDQQLTRRRWLQSAGGFVDRRGVSSRRRIRRRIPVRPLAAAPARRRVPTSPAGWRATWWTPATGVCRPRSRAKPSTGSSTRSAAMVSGARLKPGEMAIQYVRGQGGVAGGVGPHDRTSGRRPSTRRWPTGCSRHADETDDFEPVTKAHPGCAVVPAALAMAEREDRSGTELLRGGHARLRSLLPLSPGARTGSGARHASQRRGRQRDVRQRGGRGLAGAPG